MHRRSAPFGIRLRPQRKFSRGRWRKQRETGRSPRRRPRSRLFNLSEVALEDANLVCASSVRWKYGTRLPTETLVDIAHDGGALLLVDALQSPEQTPIDRHEWGADIVAAADDK
ncbi:MAG: aminotransferase class V-fold PLP-dependent enzyme [Halobacteriota archaeon]